jgi:hypothetical protein
VASVTQWAVYEAALEGSHEYDNPFWDVTVDVHLTAPSGARHSVEAFWDGARTWRVRFSPDEVGMWRWMSDCSDDANAGLHAQEGAFECVSFTGDNPIYRHGPLRLAADGHHLEHADDTPFFWLGNTAWNAVMTAEEADWNAYLRLRRQQGFAAIQFVSTQFRALTVGQRGLTAFEGTERIRLRPEFFRRMDPKVDAINAHGMIAVPVALWAFGPGDPGQALAEADAIRLARYLLARWGAHQTIWILGSDGPFSGDDAERWRRIGRAAFGDRHDRLVTMLPRGLVWLGNEFRHEDWFDVAGYQSGHGDAPHDLRWLVLGPPARDWCTEPVRPSINLEPNFEGHLSYQGRTRFTDYHVRRAAYWSLLVAPPAGWIYANNPTWVWSEETTVPEDHPHLGPVEPWREGLTTPGLRSMEVLRRLFDDLPWWRLRPAPELLTEQPGERDPRLFVAAARTVEGTLVLVYLPGAGLSDAAYLTPAWIARSPSGGHILRLDTSGLRRPAVARWCDPRNGARFDAARVTGAIDTFVAPDNDDWLLLIEQEERFGSPRQA